MNRFYALLVLGAFFVICVWLVIGSLFAQKNRRQRIQSAFEAECDDRHAECKPEVKTLIALYLSMAAKHGPPRPANHSCLGGGPRRAAA